MYTMHSSLYILVICIDIEVAHPTVTALLEHLKTEEYVSSCLSDMFTSLWH